ncbi:pyridoxine/pyridoxamine 5'-phosphate oxidase-like [Onthophagus taurus]|uniref:pyridoxine/pyridoxamine 5'-phosphate oxidase-like n=1 Tax=Onthophagus taurus TaxID=166361 RepID=UPI000C20F418|nr:pyridoxine-5'-phosphate oxidase-like [Onthophagus taurus]
MASKIISGIASIEVNTSDPFQLFYLWKEEAFRCLSKPNTLNVMNLATSSKDGCVSNRNIQILRYDPDGFVFLTDSSSRKAKDIADNPNVASTFLWCYSNDGGEIITKQIRLQGVINKLDLDQTKELYDAAPTFRKIRYNVCKQGLIVDQKEIKKIHDKILEDVENGRILEMPSYVAAYKLLPSAMEFYYGYDNFTADRVLFTYRGNNWNYVHLSA